MGTTTRIILALAVAASAAIAPVAVAHEEATTANDDVAVAAASGFSDVPSSHWAKTSIDYVAGDRNWMRDFGEDEFRPAKRLRRRHLARAVVRAFASGEAQDSEVTFKDMSSDNAFFHFANVAVKLGWMTARGDKFRPGNLVPKRDLDRALVRALSLGPEIAGLRQIQTADGKSFDRPAGFPNLVLALQLGLHYNHPTGSEYLERLPGENVRRSDGAYALHQAVLAQGTWKIGALSRYRSMVLPEMNKKRRQAVQFALQYVGYPYLWAGEWHEKTPAGYCCGAQATGGFDCSGFAWWVLKSPGGGWDNTTHRPYHGWALPERASRYQAQAAPKKITYKNTRPGDLMFFAGNGGSTWGSVDHAGVYAGSGWMVDAASGRAGVGIAWVDSGWYRDHFVWTRRVIS